MTAPITNASDLNHEIVRTQVFAEMVHENTLRPFMGKDESAAIQMIEDPSAQAGGTVHVPFTYALSDGYKIDSQQLQGNEEDLQYFSDSIQIRPVRYAAKVEDFDITEQRTPFEVFQTVRSRLVTRGAEIMRDNILDALGEVTEGRNQNRYLYGVTDANWNATHTTALANIDTTDDKMTTGVIAEAKEKAQLGGNTSGVAKSTKIRPVKMVQDNGAISSMFVMLLHPTAARQLKDDTDYKNAALYRTEANAPKLVDGSRYMGNYNGVLLYELDEITRLSDNTTPGSMFSYTRTDLTTAGASSSAVNHNLLLGAQAVGVGLAGAPMFREESEDYGRIRGIGVTELYGVTKLVFNSVDNGVVHVFTSAG